MIKIDNLSNTYINKPMLKNISLSIKEGDFFALFGEDDAGKTTLLHILMGFQTKYQGTAHIFGKSAADWTNEERSQVRFVPDNIVWEQHMTGADYLRFSHSHCANYDEKLQKELCKEWELPLGKQLLNMTYQENKFFQIAAAACAKPRLLILDEPMNFLRMDGYRNLLKKLQQWNKAGITILLTVEEYEHAQNYCKTFSYLEEGELKKTWKAQKPDVRWKVITVRGEAPKQFQSLMDKTIYKDVHRESYVYQGEPGSLAKHLKTLGDLDYIAEEMTWKEQWDEDYSRWE